MNKNIISSEDANLLLKRLVSDKVLTTASFSSLTGFRMQFTGVLDERTAATQGVLIKKVLASGQFDSLMIPFFNRNVEFSYDDARGIPPDLHKTAAEVGDTVLLIRFLAPDDLTKALETLSLFFTI